MAEKSVSITFHEGVGIDQIHEALTRVVSGFRPHGCLTCGLGGIDVYLRASDPAPEEVAELKEVRALPSVMQVSVSSL